MSSTYDDDDDRGKQHHDRSAKYFYLSNSDNTECKVFFTCNAVLHSASADNDNRNHIYKFITLTSKQQIGIIGGL